MGISVLVTMVSARLHAPIQRCFKNQFESEIFPLIPFGGGFDAKIAIVQL